MNQRVMAKLQTQDRTKPTTAQIEYASALMLKAGYSAEDVREMYGKDLDELTRGEMARFIDDLRRELYG